MTSDIFWNFQVNDIEIKIQFKATEEADNISVWNFNSKTYDEIIGRIRDDQRVTHVILKLAGPIPVEQFDADYGLAHEADP